MHVTFTESVPSLRVSFVDNGSDINSNLSNGTVYRASFTVIETYRFTVDFTTGAPSTGGGGGTPGGSDTQVQFNDSGSFGGDAGFTYNKTTDIATLGGLNVTGLTASQITATDGSKNLQSLTTATYPSLTELAYVKGVTSALQTQLNAKATTQQTDFISGYITLAEDKTYKIIVKIPYSCTIINTITICESGTCTATFQINTTNISGIANAVSTAEKDETKNDDVSSGDDIQIRVSSNASCVGLSYTIVITRTLS